MIEQSVYLPYEIDHIDLVCADISQYFTFPIHFPNRDVKTKEQ